MNTALYLRRHLTLCLLESRINRQLVNHKLLVNKALLHQFNIVAYCYYERSPLS